MEKSSGSLQNIEIAILRRIILPPNAGVQVNKVIDEKSSIDHVGEGLQGTEVEGCLSSLLML